MNQFIKTAELCEVLKTSRKQLLERAREEKWAMAKTSGGILFVADKLPLSVQFKLTEKMLDERNEKKALEGDGCFAAAKEKDREIASWRTVLITAFLGCGKSAEVFISAYNRQEVSKTVYSKLGNVSLPTFYRLLKAYKTGGTYALMPKQSNSRGKNGRSLSQQEKDLLKFYWLDSTQPSMSHALQKMLLTCTTSRCTYQTARRYLLSLPPMVRDFFRLGKTRFENLYLPYVEQDIVAYSSLDCVVSDHHCLDCVVIYKGRLIRPWLTTFQDYRSGKVLGWCPCVTPSSLSIIVAFYMVCYYYGIPLKAIFDNGKDYRSKLLNGFTFLVKNQLDSLCEEETEIYIAGIFAILGTDVHFTRTYSGKSKGRQERYFRIIGEYLAKNIGTYLGSDTRTRPEEAQLIYRSLDGKAKRTDIPTWDDFVTRCNTMIPYINDNFVSQGKGIEGMTRSEAFKKFKTKEFRRVSNEDLQAALCSGSVRKCGRNGITVNGIRYWDDALVQYVGCDVVVRTKLVFDNKALVYATSGQFICECEGDYFFEDTDNKKIAIEKVERVKKLSLAKAAELGSAGEVALDADVSIMHKVAANIYNQAPESIDNILGIAWQDESKLKSEKDVSGGEICRNKYKSLLDADDTDYIDFPAEKIS